MGFVTLEDELGGVECVFFSEPWANSKAALAAAVPLLVRGKLEKRQGENGEECKIIAESAELLTEVRERRTRAVHLVLEVAELTENLTELQTLLEASPGNCPVRLHLRVPDMAWVELEPKEGFRVVPDDPLLQGIEMLFRRPNVVRLT